MAEEKIFSDGKFGDEMEFLVNDGNAGADGLGGGIKIDWCVVDEEGTRIGLVSTGEDFEEGAFAGSPFSPSRA